jgi:hypothetical protein
VKKLILMLSVAGLVVGTVGGAALVGRSSYERETFRFYPH